MRTNTSSEADSAVVHAVDRLGIEAEFAAMPQSLVEVLHTPAEDEEAFNAYQRFLEREPGYAARVLSLANSPALGPRAPVRDLHAALTWLGTIGVRGAILSVAVMDAARGQSRLLLQAAACASFCGRTAQLIAQRDAGEFFVAGLLHNVGKLLIINAPHPPSAAIRARLVDGTLTVEEEREAIGCSHGEVGAWFATRWRLPAELADAIAHGGAPARDAGVLVQVVAQGREWVRNFSLDALEAPPDTTGVIAYFEESHGVPRRRLLEALDGLGSDVELLTGHLQEKPATLAHTVQLLQQANLALGDLNAQAEAQRRDAEDQVRHMRLLQELVASSGAEESLGVLCQNAVMLISKRLGLGVVSIVRPNAQGELVVEAGVGIPRGVVGDPNAIPEGALSRTVMKEGRALLILDMATDAVFGLSAHATRYTTASALSVPVVHAGKVLGVLNVNNKINRQPLNDRDKRLLETIGQHLGSLLNAEEQRMRHERSERRFQALAEATPAALAGFDEFGIIWLWNHSAERLTGIPADEAIGRPIPPTLIPDENPGMPAAWQECLRANKTVHNAPGSIRDRKGRSASILSTIVPLEGGRFGVWMGVNITGERNAQLDAKKRALEIAAMNRVMTRILSELDRDRMLAIFMEEAVTAAAVERGALIALDKGTPSKVLVAHGFQGMMEPGELIAWVATALSSDVSHYLDATTAEDPASKSFLEREGIRDAIFVRLPVPTERGFVLIGCNTAGPGAVDNATRVLEDMATVAAIGLRVANDLESRLRYEQLRVAASMAVTYNHETNNALQVIQAAVDFARQAGHGIEGEDLKQVEQAIHVIQKLNEALGSQFVPTFTRYADGLDMIDTRASFRPQNPQEGPA